MLTYTRKYGKYTFYRFGEPEFQTKNAKLAEEFIKKFKARRIGT